MRPYPPAQVFATVLVDELVRLGLRHVVVCPGSRSAPLAYAVLAHQRAGLLEVHVRIDERAAAFLALGIGKATGMPAAVITTSGTAVANCHPAVLEAHEARVPLLLLSADRPHELRWTRANQTTRQPGMFGDSVRLTLDFAAPLDSADRVRFWRTSADRAVAAAAGTLGGLPGPVHVNIPLREPLTPQWPDDGAVTDALAFVDADLPEPYRGRPDGSPWTSVPLTGGADERPGHQLADVPRTLVVVGDAAEQVRDAAYDFAGGRGYPVLAEPFGRTHRVGTPAAPLSQSLLIAETSFAQDEENLPDRVLVVGRLTLSRAVGDLLRRSGASVEICSTDPSWPDPSHIAGRVHHWSALLTEADTTPAAHTSQCQRSPGEPTRFGARWEGAALRTADVVDRMVPSTWPSGMSVARATLAALPAGSRLFLGSSSLIRDISYVRGRDGVEIVANRGLAGIDGCVSTAAGMALADSATPTFALMGDLTFLHDSAALTIGPDEREPDLVVIVVNDDGGAIFETLEYGSSEMKGRDEEAFRRLFATPTGTCLAHIAQAHQVEHVEVVDSEQLGQELVRPVRGMRVLEVRLPCPRARADRAALITAASEALGRP